MGWREGIVRLWRAAKLQLGFRQSEQERYSAALEEWQASRPSLRVNRCRCRKCGSVIESRFTHDFQECACGAIFTDGGTSYIRRGAEDPSLIEDLSEWEEPGA